jgi:hypothetical protein
MSLRHFDGCGTDLDACVALGGRFPIPDDAVNRSGSTARAGIRSGTPAVADQQHWVERPELHTLGVAPPD